MTSTGRRAIETLEMLEQRLEALERKISEARLHLPAHSVKPAVMTMLLDLEDERDALMERIAELKKKGA